MTRSAVVLDVMPSYQGQRSNAGNKVDGVGRNRRYPNMCTKDDEGHEEVNASELRSIKSQVPPWLFSVCTRSRLRQQEYACVRFVFILNQIVTSETGKSFHARFVNILKAWQIIILLTKCK